MTDIPRDFLAPGLPLFMLEVFSLPSHSSFESFRFFNLDDTELAAAAFVPGATGGIENRAAAAVH